MSEIVEPETKEEPVEEEPAIIEIVDEEEKLEEPPCQEPVDLSQTETNLDIASMKHDIEKCKLKRDIIEGIKRLAPGRFTNKELKKMTRANLKKLLTEVFEGKCRETLVGPDDEKMPEEPAQAQKRRDGKMVTEAMYQVLLGVCSLTEGLTKRFSGYLGGMCLHEWRATIDQSDFTRETLKQVLYEVYLEHQETLTLMMSKEGRLICCLVLSGMQCVRKYSPELENGQRFRNSMEQDDLYSRCPQPRENEPRPIPHPRSFSAHMRSHPFVRKRRLSNTMGVSNGQGDAAPNLP